MITTIIFDFGDVLVQDLVNVFEIKYGYQKLPKSTKQKYDRILHLAEIGKIPTNTYLKTTSEFLAPHLKPKSIENYFLSAKKLPGIKLLPKLKKHYRVAILTNNQKNWMEKFETSSKIHLEGIPVFNSAKIGFRKPHKNIYNYALKKLKAKPEECVFIDDKLENIKPAKALGLHTILYKQNISDLKKQLKKLGIKI